MNPFALALTTLFHPIDSLDIIKRERERKRALIPAVVLLLLAFFVNYLYVFIVSFQLQEKEAIDANLLLECGIIDAVISEGEGPAHENPEEAVAAVRDYVRGAYKELADLSPDELVRQRQERFAKF